MTLDLGLPLGTMAPDFSIPTESGIIVHLDQVIGPMPVLIYFYPSDFGMMCAVVMRAFREMYEELRKYCVFLPISTNTTYSHGAWGEGLRLPFSLLSDVDSKVSKEYRVEGGTNEYLMGRSYRAIFILDGKGTIRYRWAPDDPSLEPDYDLVLRTVKELDGE
jgi:peroxiredoxin Q/BCP